MRKKIFVVFALLLVSLMVFASCDLGMGVSDFQKFNDMLKLDYSEIHVLVNTKTDAAELDGEFTLKFGDGEITIDYSFEKINSFEIGQDGTVIAPDGDFITTESGTVVVRDGVIVEGDIGVKLPDELDVYVGGFSFKQAFFSNITAKNAKFEADVVNPKGFTGNDSIECTDMHVVVFQNITAGTLSSIDLTYKSSNGAEVTINYLFTK